ncbi:MAG: hypothetical protein ACTSW1_01220 [Candidatus Hodarchaeales archaeon]
MDTAWIGVIGVIGGAIIGAGIQEFRLWGERKDKYRVMSFDRRLEAHQQAFAALHELNRILNTGVSKDIDRTAIETRKWWDKNCLFLDEKSRSLMLKTINLSHQYAGDLLAASTGISKQHRTNIGRDVWKYRGMHPILFGVLNKL